MIPNLDLIGGNNNVGSIVEAMSGADSTQAKNTVTANNVSKLNDEFKQYPVYNNRFIFYILLTKLKTKNSPFFESKSFFK